MQEGFTVWLTGCAKSGKTTLATLLERYLYQAGMSYVQRLDGNIVRFDLSPDLGFSKKDRDENVRRIAFVAELLSNNGVATLVSCISPYRAARDKAKRCCLNFVEVYVACPIEVAKKRDEEGLYSRAECGDLAHFTGVSDPYEEPEQPDLVVYTDRETKTESLNKILSVLKTRGLILLEGPNQGDQQARDQQH